jgi:hypothetical protein
MSARWQPSLEDYIDIASYLLGADRAAIAGLPRIALAESALYAPFASFGSVEAYHSPAVKASMPVTGDAVRTGSSPGLATRGAPARRLLPESTPRASVSMDTRHMRARVSLATDAKSARHGRNDRFTRDRKRLGAPRDQHGMSAGWEVQGPRAGHSGTRLGAHRVARGRCDRVVSSQT